MNLVNCLIIIMLYCRDHYSSDLHISISPDIYLTMRSDYCYEYQHHNSLPSSCDIAGSWGERHGPFRAQIHSQGG